MGFRNGIVMRNRQASSRGHVRNVGVNSRSQSVVFQPAVLSSMQRGVAVLTAIIKPTLGPGMRHVLIERPDNRQSPEILDQSGLIARRVIEIQDRDMNVGAMHLRQVLRQQYDEVRDGVATTAVIFDAVFRAGAKEVTAGTNPHQLRSSVIRMLPMIEQHVQSLATPVHTARQLTGLAQSLGGDSALSALLADVVSTLGTDGAIAIRPGYRSELHAEFIDGAYWDEGLLANPAGEVPAIGSTSAAEASVLVSDLPLNNPEDLIHLSKLTNEVESRAIVIVARSVSDRVKGYLTTNAHLFGSRMIIVRTPGVSEPAQRAAVQDLVTLAGGRPVIDAAGCRFNGVEITDLGHARRVWANRSHFGLIGGSGGTNRLRSHILSLRKAKAESLDHRQRDELQERIGRLTGSLAVVSISGGDAYDAKEMVASRVVHGMQRALKDGVLPGGGAAFLSSSRMIKRQCLDDPVDQAAQRTLIAGLRAPMQVIIENAGFEAQPIMARIDCDDNALGFDVESASLADMVRNGVVDVRSVALAALTRGVSAAIHALTVDTIVHSTPPANGARK